MTIRQVVHHCSNLLCAAGYHCNFINEKYILGNLRIEEGRATAVTVTGKQWNIVQPIGHWLNLERD